MNPESSTDSPCPAEDVQPIDPPYEAPKVQSIQLSIEAAEALT